MRAVEIPDFGYPPVDDELMNFLAGMYSGHGAAATRIGNWILVDDGKLLTRASHFDHKDAPGSRILQADFVTVSAAGNHIVESFAGIGFDLATAIEDACRGFQDSSFHAIFSTLLDRECTHIEREEWMIAGLKRMVTLGLIRMRGEFPDDSWPALFDSTKTLIEDCDLPSGLHCFRIFYCHMPSGKPTIEVLIDNQEVTALQEQIGALKWPCSADSYSIRLFFMVQDLQERQYK